MGEAVDTCRDLIYKCMQDGYSDSEIVLFVGIDAMNQIKDENHHTSKANPLESNPTYSIDGVPVFVASKLDRDEVMALGDHHMSSKSRFTSQLL